jgi:two-component system, NarL family, response regulator
MPAVPTLPRIRLLLVDDHPVMRAGLANVLATDTGFDVVAQADDGETALEIWRSFSPDVTLLDINLGGMDGIETLRRMRAERPTAKILILTSSESGEDARLALKAGACGYVIKSIRAADLSEAIRTVHAGGQVVSEKVNRKLTEDQGSRHLSPRETEVLGLVRQGFTNDEIGRLLGISERTARAHMGTILEKLHASDRAAAVARGFETGILKA